MKTRKIIILSVSLALLLATAAGAYALSPKKTAKAEPVWSEGVMRISINTISGSMEKINADKEYEERMSVEVCDADGNLICKSSDCHIHAHGNSSFLFSEKKSYTLKLLSACNLLSHSETDSYVLVSNFADGSMLLNKMVYDTARRASPYWSPACDFAEVYFNGEYGGLYLLVEKIEPELLGIEQGGFLCETEAELQLSSGSDGFVRNVVCPKNHSSTRNEKITNKLLSVRAAAMAEDGYDPKTGKHYSELIDVESFARKYLIEEIFQNTDANLNSNYSYSVNGDIIIDGPCWDYDRTLKAKPDVFIALETVLIFRENLKPLYYYLYQKEDFRTLVQDLYKNEYLPIIEEYLNGGLDALNARIAAARARDLSVWNDVYSNDTPVETDGIPLDAASIKEYLGKRIEFLSRAWIDGDDLYADVDMRLGRIVYPEKSDGGSDNVFRLDSRRVLGEAFPIIFVCAFALLLFFDCHAKKHNKKFSHLIKDNL